MNHKKISQALIETPLGAMLALADEQRLYLLEFNDHPKLPQKIEKIKQLTQSSIISEYTQQIKSIESELKLYFFGDLTAFTTPVFFHGTPFQVSVWQELQKIMCGQTRSYGQIAQALSKPTAYRAVAQANGANNLPIIIPCHRVINADGTLSGYSGGVARKKWLLEHEAQIFVKNRPS